MKIPTSISSKFKINRGGRFLGFGLSPETDWKIIILTFMICMFLVLIGCAYFFIKIDNGGFLPVTDEEKTPSSSFNINRVRQTVNYYDNKSKELEIIKSTPEDILDPSI
jgi:hypothetical protein